MNIEQFHSATTKGIACCKKRVASTRFQVICNLVVIGYDGHRFVTYLCLIYVYLPLQDSLIFYEKRKYTHINVLIKSMFQICVKCDDTSTVSRKDPLK